MVELDPRAEAVLRAVIRQHIVSGEPVGSKSVTEGARLDLSPASIRNVMAELEEQGYLQQPHTSAGRLPTDSAYRVYVDRLLPRSRVASEPCRSTRRRLSKVRTFRSAARYR